MALPYIFASVTTMTTPQLDSNFAALGAVAPIPCTVTGTNTLALTPLTNVATVSAYQNYMQFTGIVANTNTGAATAQVGALTALPVYKDTSSGPVALTGNEFIANAVFILMYDSTLNGGGGGFHLLDNQFVSVSGVYLPLAGGTLTGALVGTTATFSGPISASNATVTNATLSGSITAGLGIFTTASITGALTASTATISIATISTLAGVTFSTLSVTAFSANTITAGASGTGISMVYNQLVTYSSVTLSAFGGESQKTFTVPGLSTSLCVCAISCIGQDLAAVTPHAYWISGSTIGAVLVNLATVSQVITATLNVAVLVF